MSDPAERFAANRELRDQALGVLTERYGRLKSGLADKGVGERLADHAKVKAGAAAKEALEIASDSRGVIAATLLALLAWYFRKPLITLASKQLPRVQNIWDNVMAGFDKGRFDQGPGA